MELMRELTQARRQPNTFNYDYVAHLLAFDTVIERALEQMKDATSRHQLIQRLMAVSIHGLVKTHLPRDTLLEQSIRVILEQGLDASKLPSFLQKHLKNKELDLEAYHPNIKAIVHDPLCCQWLGCDELNQVVLCLWGHRYGTDIPKRVIPCVERGGVSVFAQYFRHYAKMLGIPVWVFPRC